jgi:hypothetical protein
MATQVQVRRLAGNLGSLLAVAVAVATTAMVLISVLIWIADGLKPLPVSFGRTVVGVAGLVVAPLGYAALGAVLARHVAHNPTGWLFLIAGFALGTMLPVNLMVAAAHETLRPADPTVVAIAWLRNALATPTVLTTLILAAALFPTGRPPTPRWRVATVLPLIGGALLAISAAVDPVGMVSYPSIANPTAAGLEAAWLVTAVRILGVALLIGGGATAVVALVIRYRRGADMVRRQLRWIILAAAVTGTAAVPFILTRYLVEVPDVIGELFAAGAQIGSVSFPAATAIAMSRHRLFDLDVFLGRTLVYVPLMAILGGLYTAAIALFQRLFTGITGSTSDVAIVLTVLVVAAAFTPIRKALEALVERRFPQGDRATTQAPSEIPSSQPPAQPVRDPRRGTPAPAPWRLLMVGPDGTVECPVIGHRDAADCVRCDRLQSIIHGTDREAVVCSAPTRP